MREGMEIVIDWLAVGGVTAGLTALGRGQEVENPSMFP